MGRAARWVSAGWLSFRIPRVLAGVAGWWQAAERSAVSAACDYSGIPARISRMLNESHTELIERAALLIAALLVREYGAPWARVSVYKPDALDGVKGIGVTIERTAGEIRDLERRGVL